MKLGEASLYRLFRRSRYAQVCLDAGEDSAEEKMDHLERERFGVAALGFCLRHSKEFRKHFFDTICWIPGDPTNISHLEIQVEPHHWADLKLIYEGPEGRFVWVVECKIDAPLGPKQDPTDPAFTKSGYGALFERLEHPATNLRYIVLGAREDLKLEPNQKAGTILLQQKHWHQLTEEDAPTDSLRCDLMQTLGLLGIKGLRMVRASKINVRTGFDSVAQAHEVLSTLGSPAVYNFRNSYWRIKPEPRDAEHFLLGAYLHRPPPQKSTSQFHRNLHALLDSPGDIVLWVGYESGPSFPDGFRRSVWFYCSKAKATPFLESLSGKFATAKPDSDGLVSCVVVTSSPSEDKSDLAWFRNVIDTAMSFKKTL